MPPFFIALVNNSGYIPTCKACLENISPPYGYSATSVVKPVVRLNNHLSNVHDLTDRTENSIAVGINGKGSYRAAAILL